MPRHIALSFYQRNHLPLKAIVLAVLCAAVAWQAAPASAQQGSTRPTECWRGWGYLLDGQSRAYKSQEMLLVTLGPTLWETGRPVELFLLDRASGHISEVPPITVIPEGPRLYYRGRLNYMDTVAAIQGSQDLMTLGLSHIEPAQPGVPAKEQYNRWACGLGEE
ncbi:hypothetical protein [Pelagibius sp.]|uniref:hypothetical protein n=1 Tax=Pelagibius sp. TaxID=1931238 RepID=UPI002619FB34|nr:hypothetical protein [Pelagibius sp.]